MIDMADSKVEYPAPDCLAPAAIEAKTEVAGVTKANLPVAKAFLLAMFAGAFIAFGGLFFTVFLSDSTLGWGAQRVVGGAGRLDVHHLHGGRKRLLRAGAVGLRVEDQLRVVPARRPSALQTEHREIFPQDRDIVKAPRQKHAVLAAPRGKLRGGLWKTHTLFAEQTVADAGERGDLAVLELVRDLLLLRHAHGADLHDLAAHRRRQRLFRAV